MPPFTPVLPCLYAVRVWMCVCVALHLSPHIRHISVLCVLFYDAFHACVAIYIRRPCINERLCCPFHVCVTIQLCVRQHNVYKCAFALPFVWYEWFILCVCVAVCVALHTSIVTHTWSHDVVGYQYDYGWIWIFFFTLERLCCPTHLCCHTYMMLACCVRCCLSFLACLNMYICVCVFDSVCICVCERARVCVYAPFTPVLPRISLKIRGNTVAIP